MKTLIVIVATGITNFVTLPKTQNMYYANGIYLTVQDFQNRHLTLPFNNNDHTKSFKEPWGHAHEIWIKTPDSTYKFFYADIWGYRRDGEDRRIYNEEAYRIEGTEKICTYTTSVLVDKFPENKNYFSKDLVSAIHPITKGDLLEIYHSNEYFTEKLHTLKWPHSVLDWDKQKHQYSFVNWLNGNKD